VSRNVINPSRFEVLAASHQATLVVNERGILHFLSSRAEGLLECEADEVVGEPLWTIAAQWQIPLASELKSLFEGRQGNVLELYHEETGHLFRLTSTLQDNLLQDALIVIDLEQLKDDGASRGVREQVHGKFRHEVREQTGAVEVLRRGRQHDSLTDLLTGFANRFGLLDTLNHSSTWQHGTFLLLDIDRFQNLNDSLGPRFGDDLLVAFSQRLLHALRPDDATARLGSDEFGILLPQTDEQEAILVAQRLQKSLEHPFILQGSKIAVTVSIGILSILESYSTPDAMLRDADLALHHAKSLGESSVAVFDPALREELLARVALEKSLKEAIINRELEVYYQPIFDLRTNEVVGLETLSRWHRPEGAIPPATFIRIAEETGLILDIDKWVLERACQQMATWQGLGFLTVPLNINVSGNHFAQKDMARHFESVLQTHNMKPDGIHLELTETVLMDESEQTQETLQDLQRLGIKLHIDDFGTGYASLSYLQRFSAHGLKIDRSFVNNLQDRKSYELIRAVIAMAHALNMKVVAEGIETPWQRQELEGLGCDYGQGYLLSKPLPAKDIEPLLASVTVKQQSVTHLSLFKN
jgi:diguanylate cyclase (GGDEF)-like protein